jgi:AraC-like DNA-binding protein
VKRKFLATSVGIVVTLLPQPERQRRLELAVAGHHTVVSCRDWGALCETCQRQPVSLAVFDLYAGDRPALDSLRQLRRLFPRLITVVYIEGTSARLRDVFDAGRAGIDGLVLADVDDAPHALAAILERAAARSAAAQLRGRLDRCRLVVRDAIMLTVTRAHERLTPQRLAAAVSSGRRTLTAYLAEDGFPPPRQLITWGQLLIAAQLLEDPARSADTVAAALDFPSASAFRNTCRRYLGLTPSELRERGPLFVVDQLLGGRRHDTASAA